MEATLISTEAQEKIEKLMDFCKSVQVVDIKTNEQYVEADKTLGQIKKVIAKIEDERKAEKEPYLQKGRDVDTWYNSKKAALESLKGKISPSLIAYEQEQERLRQEEQRKNDAIAETKRLEAEAAAQRERDKADRLRKEAEELASKDRAAADALLVRAAAADTRADNKEIKASEIQSQVVQKELPKTNSYLRDNWKMKITDPDGFVQYCASNGLLFLLQPNETACNNHAKTLHRSVKFQGAETVNEQIRTNKGNIPI